MLSTQRLLVLIALLLGPFFFVGCVGDLSLEDLPLVGGGGTPVPTVTPTAAPTVPPTPEPYSLAGLRAFIDAAEAARRADRPQLVSSYMAEMPPSPLTGPGEAAFIYQGPGFEVGLNGDLNNWIEDEALPLSQIEGSDFWYLFVPLEDQARIDYMMRVDGREQLDARNPVSAVGEQGPRSKLVMPGYEPPPELALGLPRLGPEQRGRLEQRTLDSAILQQTRTAFVYLPAGEPPAGGRYPTVYILDGTDYLNLVDAQALLDRLIASEAIPPLVAVFVPPIDQRAEYSLNEDYVNFLTGELVPFIRSGYPVRVDPVQTAVLGPGLGGLTAVYAAAVEPAIFGQAAAQSAPFAARGEALLRLFDLQEPLPLRLHLVVGSYETAVGGDPTTGNHLAANRTLAATLGRKGYDFAYVERPEGHSWELWGSQLGAALRFFFAQ